MMRVNRDAYTKLIDEDIAWLNKVAPEHSLEKMHIEEVLRNSITEFYGEEKEEDVQ